MACHVPYATSSCPQTSIQNTANAPFKALTSAPLGPSRDSASLRRTNLRASATRRSPVHNGLQPWDAATCSYAPKALLFQWQPEAAQPHVSRVTARNPGVFVAGRAGAPHECAPTSCTVCLLPSLLHGVMLAAPPTNTAGRMQLCASTV